MLFTSVFGSLAVSFLRNLPQVREKCLDIASFLLIRSQIQFLEYVMGSSAILEELFYLHQ